jgi:hypothetical protein
MKSNALPTAGAGAGTKESPSEVSALQRITRKQGEDDTKINSFAEDVQESEAFSLAT